MGILIATNNSDNKAGQVVIYFRFPYYQKQPPKVFYLKGVVRNFSKFTGKHLCQSLSESLRVSQSLPESLRVSQVFSCEF